MMGAADPPRSRRVLRLIAIERGGRGVLLLAAGIYLLFHLRSDFGRLAERVARAIEIDPRRPFFHRFVAHLHHLHASELHLLGSEGRGSRVRGASPEPLRLRPAPALSLR